MTSLQIEIGDQAPTALYRFYDADRNLLYVGISDNLRMRLASHAAEKSWWPDVAHKTVEWFRTRESAAEAEVVAIREEQPKHNVIAALRPAVTKFRRDESGAVSCVARDSRETRACGITAQGAWWCECSPDTLLYKPMPRHCCAHLVALGMKVHASECEDH